MRKIRLLVGVACVVATMAAAAETSRPPSKDEQRAMSPAEALERLKAGNERFVAGKSLPRDWTAWRAQTASGQYPFAMILSCIDSRASSEIVFDQGFGKIFNARVAGTVLDDDALGGMEFACRLAGAKLIVVVGHTKCGAVKGAAAGAQLGHLTGLLAKMEPAVRAAKAQQPGMAPAEEHFVELVTELNVRHVTRQIRERSAVLREMIDAGQLAVVGGIQDLETGRVRFLED